MEYLTTQDDYKLTGDLPDQFPLVCNGWTKPYTHFLTISTTCPSTELIGFIISSSCLVLVSPWAFPKFTSAWSAIQFCSQFVWKVEFQCYGPDRRQLVGKQSISKNTWSMFHGMFKPVPNSGSAIDLERMWRRNQVRASFDENSDHCSQKGGVPRIHTSFPCDL